MTVKELINRLKKLDPNMNVVMCMDWTTLPKDERPHKCKTCGYDPQWEDDLGDIGVASQVYLLNKHFK